MCVCVCEESDVSLDVPQVEKDHFSILKMQITNLLSRGDHYARLPFKEPSRKDTKCIFARIEMCGDL